ncbi:hypothetical protein [Cupriavidus necator]
MRKAPMSVSEILLRSSPRGHRATPRLQVSPRELRRMPHPPRLATGNPVAVNPDRALHALAQAREPVMKLFETAGAHAAPSLPVV